MSGLRISLLGPFDCRDGEGNCIVLPTRKAEAIIALLAVSCGEARTREKIAGLLWADTTEARARANLRKTLSRLKRALRPRADGCLEVRASGLSLDPDRVEVDMRQFEELACTGTPDALQEAAALYRGQFLEGLRFSSEDLDDWLTVTRQNLEERARTVFDRLLNHYVVTGAIERAIEAALRLLAMDPLQEGVHRTLIRLYMHQERLGAAYRQYEACRDVLAQELDVAPGPETEKLKAELLRRLPAGGGDDVSKAHADTDLALREAAAPGGYASRSPYSRFRCRAATRIWRIWATASPRTSPSISDAFQNSTSLRRSRLSPTGLRTQIPAALAPS